MNLKVTLQLELGELDALVKIANSIGYTLAEPWSDDDKKDMARRAVYFLVGKAVTKPKGD